MTNEWVETTLGDVVQIMYGKDHKHLQNGLIPVYGSGGIMRYADRSLFEDESILIPRKGTLNNIIYVNKPCWTVDTMFWTKINKSKAYPKFIFYQLTMINFVELNVGSAVPSLTVPVLNNIPLLLPPLPVQRRIADILGTLDDKIELNRRMNATLEAMARALFKAWFVDFEPVRAKLDGRWQRGQSLPGLPAHLYDLFPDQLVDSELGEIPMGWGVRSLDNIANYLNGLALQKYPPRDEPTLPVIKIAQLRKGDSIGADRCNTDLPNNYIVQDGDVLFSWSGSLEVELWCGGPGALNQHLFKVTSAEFPKWFYYLWTLYHLDDFRLIAADKATTMGHIQRGHIAAAKVLVPTPTLLEAMTRSISPLIEQIVDNRIQSRTLTTLRDTLLPKLLSGEVDISSFFQSKVNKDEN